MSSKSFLYLAYFILFTSCSSNDTKDHVTRQAEFIYRTHQERLFAIEPLQKQKPKPYPWTTSVNTRHPIVTKEYFRCKGSSLNPPRQIQVKDKLERISDCAGFEKHSLPLRDGKEFIYPILIDLLNYLQMKTEKKVVITSGHRCPEHNTYADSDPINQYSKHMIGGEVSFYVQGNEEKPEEIVQIILDYYKVKYPDKKEWSEFVTYEKQDTNVSTPPLFNKEIFIKLFKKTEGRNFDNRHPYPYVSIQVRYDKEKNERVVYSWKEAHTNYLRN